MRILNIKSVILFLFISLSVANVLGQECPSPTQSGKSIRTAIVIDPSSEISKNSRSNAQSEISNTIDSINRNNGLVLISTEIKNGHLSDATFHKRPMFKIPVKAPLWCDVKCKRLFGKCTTEDEFNDLKSEFNDDLMGFEEELQSYLDSLFNSPSTGKSPILNALNSLDHKICDEECDQLWIISDMLENSEIFNFYESIPKFADDLRTIIDQSGFPEKISHTTIFRINRCAKVLELQNSEEFKAFWNDYFTHITGNKPNWKYLPTGGCQ